MLTLLTAALLPLRSVARAGLASGSVARPSSITSTTTTATTAPTALTIGTAGASATSPSTVSAMSASIGAESVAAISAVAPVPTWGVGGASPIGYCAWIIAAGAEGLRLRAVVALISRLRFVVALAAIVGGSRR